MNGRQNTPFNFKTLIAAASLLNRCAATRSLRPTKQLHALAVATGSVCDHLRWTLTAAYAACGCVPYARELFDETPHGAPPSSWAALMRMYSRSGMPRHTLYLFVKMLASGRHRPDNFTYPVAIKACGDLSWLHTGASVHARTMPTGFYANVYVQNSLLAMYMSSGEMEAARQVFDEMCDQTTVSWNTMLSGYYMNGCAKEALVLLNWMKSMGVKFDSVTVVSVLPGCGYLKAVEMGRGVHAHAEVCGLGGNMKVKNTLVDMYVKCSRMKSARLIVDRMQERDVVTWTTLVAGYILNGDARSALAICPLMQGDGVIPNSVTVASLLSACASLHALKHGGCLHGWAIRRKLESEVMVETALIDMYAKCDCVDLSFRVFEGSSKMRTIPWNAILSGYIHNGHAKEAIELFKKMLAEEVPLNDATLNGLLPAYTIIVNLQQATNVHGFLIKSGFLLKIEVATCLVDIYSKCGSLVSAHAVFNEVPEERKDVFLWSVLISGYGMHGNGKVAISLFDKMVGSGVKPNEVTLTSVLQACSHAGLVDEGLALFNFILKNHLIHPQNDHYTCIVDLLGRSGRLWEASELIRTMPFRPNHAVWGALLGACVIHGNIELGEIAANRLFKLDPDNTGNYVLLAKIYAEAGRWREAENVRCRMNEIGRKVPAQSLFLI